ncbi:MAG: hypothetical protein ACI9IP_000269 [Arcticibacterium sp.]|jgi:hypothetical protein
MRNILAVYILLFFTGCAQFVPPTGGPKDKEPPSVISQYPKNGTTSFTENTLRLTFNELIDANSLRQELIITPQPKSTYDLKIKPYGIELKYDEPFLDSTTYTFNFRNGIKDLNEKNPAINLKVVFSTGTEIDSLSVSGKVTDLWTGINSKEILVGLYDLRKEDTIPILQQKPTYFTKTDTSGEYNFENIKDSEYRLIGFKDNNLNLLFNDNTEVFGFIQDTIKLDSNISNLDFDVYPYNTSPPKIQRSLSRQLTFSIKIDKDIKDIKVSFPNDNDSLTYQIRDKELVFFNHPFTPDTILTNLIVIDSAGNNVKSDNKIFFATNSRITQEPELLRIITTNIQNNKTIKKPTSYKLQFEYPITSIDTSGITITSDTTFNEPFTLTWTDSSHTSLDINTNPQAIREIKLSIAEATITNFKSDSNSTYQLINKLYQQQNFGAIDGKYPLFPGQKIIQILDVIRYKLIDYQVFTDKFNFPQLLPGSYKLRIIEDKNNNGQWDSAHFDQNLLPERITISKGSIKLKANFQLSDIQIE